MPPGEVCVAHYQIEKSLKFKNQELSMARKNNGNTTTNRTKKPSNTPETAAPQLVSETRKNVVPINLEDEIRRRAYEIYVERGSTPGDERADWLVAEREVRSRYQAQSA
jgi:hypothetical protein